MGKDKILHFLVCMLICIGVTILGLIIGLGDYCIAVGVIVALLAGIGKEAYDRKKGGIFDFNDIFADAIGILVGAALCGLFIALLA